jgi:hypothetical protein
VLGQQGSKIYGGTAGVQVCKNPGYLPILQPSARKALKIDHILRAALKPMLALVLLAMGTIFGIKMILPPSKLPGLHLMVDEKNIRN